MIMKVAVPLPKHSPMLGQEASSHTVLQVALAQDLLDLVEARGGRAGLDADPLGLFEDFACSTLTGMRDSLAAAFCLAEAL